jgi:lipopolysaccharide transport system ATP-binding protein
MQDISRGEGRTVLFVSHNMTAVQNLCKTGVLLENGTLKMVGKVDDVIHEYLSDDSSINRTTNWTPETAPSMNGITLLSARVVNSEEILYAGDAIELEFVFKSEESHPATYDITFSIKDEMNNFLFEGSTHFSSCRIVEKTSSGIYRARAVIPANLMNEGQYRVWHIFFVKDGVTLQFDYEDPISFELKRRNRDAFGYQGAKMGLLLPQVKWDMTCDDKIIVKDL